MNMSFALIFALIESILKIQIRVKLRERFFVKAKLSLVIVLDFFLCKFAEITSAA